MKEFPLSTSKERLAGIAFSVAMILCFGVLLFVLRHNTLLLVLVALGVKLIVLTCMIEGGFQKLLEEGDYTRANKRLSKYDGIYWAIVLAIYLGWSFVTMRWEFTWIVWPVAGVLFAAYREIIKAVLRAKR